MATIRSLGQVQSITPTWYPTLTYGSLAMYGDFTYDYATLYRTQPNVRICVDFLSRNIAQLGLHVYRRVDDNDRERVTRHPLARLIERPLPTWAKMTRYRLIEALVSDLGIYYNAFWLKLRDDGGAVNGLLRLPPQFVEVKGSGLLPSGYKLNMGKEFDISNDDIVHFRGYNPESPFVGLSPLETLRRTLAEEYAAGEYREGYWANAARMSGIIKRPLAAPEWGPDARRRFIEEFEQLYSGAAGSGRTAVLEEGMEWERMSFSAQESEYMEGRKLTREECARAYHIPPPMVGILDHATFSNISEQTKMLYRDTLGPWLRMIQDDVNVQLLPDFDVDEELYVEFNIMEKLAGSFEEQSAALQSAVGGPWMTRNEARGRMNLPSLDGADELIVPLNVVTGGQASPQDAEPDNPGGRASLDQPKAKALNSHQEKLRRKHEALWEETLVRHYRRQEAAIASRVPKGRKVDIGGVWFDQQRWNDELAAELYDLNRAGAADWAAYIVGETDSGLDVDWDAFMEVARPWLREHSRIQAENINGRVRDELTGALLAEEPGIAVRDVFVAAVTVWAAVQAVSAVTSIASFGSSEGARIARKRKKTWVVNSSNPREAHAAMNGETVDIDQKFSNGMKWPGDPAGGADNNAGCMCSMVFTS